MRMVKGIKNEKLWVIIGRSGLTCEQVAQKAGLSNGVVIGALTGKNIWPQNKPKIAAALGKTMDEVGFDNSELAPPVIDNNPQKEKADNTCMMMHCSKEFRALIRGAAQASNVSLSTYMRSAVREKMEREKKQAGRQQQAVQDMLSQQNWQQTPGDSFSNQPIRYPTPVEEHAEAPSLSDLLRQVAERMDSTNGDG